MKLVEKGASAVLETKKSEYKISTKWSSDDDFDTAALYKKLDGSKGIVYFGTTGENGTHGYLDKEPFIMLDKDSLTGGEENLIVGQKAIDNCSEIHLVVWDYKAIKEQRKSHFHSSDIKVHIDEHEVHPKVAEDSNFVEMASIINNNGKIAIMNKSNSGSLMNLDDADMWNIINR